MGKGRALQARAGQLTVRNKQWPQEGRIGVLQSYSRAIKPSVVGPFGPIAAGKKAHGSARLNVGKMPPPLNVGSHLMELSCDMQH